MTPSGSLGIWAFPLVTRAEIEREKLLNAIIFFTKNTRACHKLKLFKLLYFFDFQIYRETGRPATGLQYFAWPMGPVPRELFEEFDAPRADMKAALALRTAAETDPDFTGKHLTILPRVAFDDGCFTPRELAAMARLAEIFRDANADQMKEASHLPELPWHRVYEVEKQHLAQIPYALALDSKPGSITKEQAELIAEEAREVAALFK